MTERTPFDPAAHLTRLRRGGAEYLEVKWRLAWFRDLYPKGSITTECLHHAHGVAIFKATVLAIDADGQIVGSATGHAQEDAQSFGDYLEKAETAAIGRAMSGLGLGTEWAQDHELIREGPQDGSGAAEASVRPPDATPAPPAAPEGSHEAGAATPGQLRAIRALADSVNAADAWMRDQAGLPDGAPIESMTEEAAARLIGTLNALKRTLASQR